MFQWLFKATSPATDPVPRPVDTVLPDVGDTIGKNYVIDAKVGVGGAGVVYRGRDLRLDLRVALKLMPLGQEGPKLRREASTAIGLSHPFVVRTYTYERYERYELLVLEWVDGEDLHARRMRGPGRRIEASEAVGLCIDALDALQYAHDEGVVHNDVKPQNLLVGPGEQMKVCDFGIAAMVRRGEAVPGSLEGTIAYMSPERLRGEPADARSDVYAMGATLYTLLVGRSPFGTQPEQATYGHLERVPPVSEHLSAELATVVLRAMAKQPADRFQSARSMREALRALGYESRYAETSGRKWAWSSDEGVHAAAVRGRSGDEAVEADEEFEAYSHSGVWLGVDVGGAEPSARRLLGPQEVEGRSAEGAPDGASTTARVVLPGAAREAVEAHRASEVSGGGDRAEVLRSDGAVPRLTVVAAPPAPAGGAVAVRAPVAGVEGGEAASEVGVVPGDARSEAVVRSGLAAASRVAERPDGIEVVSNRPHLDPKAHDLGGAVVTGATTQGSSLVRHPGAELTAARGEVEVEWSDDVFADLMRVFDNLELPEEPVVWPSAQPEAGGPSSRGSAGPAGAWERTKVQASADVVAAHAPLRRTSLAGREPAAVGVEVPASPVSAVLPRPIAPETPTSLRGGRVVTPSRELPRQPAGAGVAPAALTGAAPVMNPSPPPMQRASARAGVATAAVTPTSAAAPVAIETRRDIFRSGARTNPAPATTAVSPAASAARPGVGSALSRVREPEPARSVAPVVRPADPVAGGPAGMVRVPVRTVREGARSVHVPAFLLDVVPVSNAEFAVWVASSGELPPAWWKGRVPPEGLRDHPVVGVTLDAARGYAAGRGKRLPTAEEWLAAAAAGGEQVFPWGARCDGSQCHCPLRRPTGTAPVGAHRASESRDGVRDLYGNVWEWTEHGALVRPSDADRHHVFGASFKHACSAPRGEVPRSEVGRHADYLYLGFRCARDVEGAR